MEAASLKALADQAAGDSDQATREAIAHFVVSDIGTYVQQLDALKERLVGRRLHDPALRMAFAQLTDGVIAAGEQTVAGFDKATAKRVKEAFRQAVRPLTAGNPFLERCLTKPRGYAGDYLMMENGYLNRVQMTGGLAGAFDRYFSDSYENVRQRKYKLCDAIRKLVLDEARGAASLKMLSLGSGPCREWVELNEERSAGAWQDRRVHLTRLICIDKDPEALAYARKQVVGNSLLESTEFIEADLFQFTKADRWRAEEQSYDFIYGVGIANYFYNAMLQNIIASAFTLVKPGGELMITHKAREGFNFPVADWLCDWVFLKRSAEEFSTVYQEALADVEGTFTFRLERIPDGTMFFGFATRTQS